MEIQKRAITLLVFDSAPERIIRKKCSMSGGKRCLGEVAKTRIKTVKIAVSLMKRQSWRSPSYREDRVAMGDIEQHDRPCLNFRAYEGDWNDYSGDVGSWESYSSERWAPSDLG